MSIPTHMSLLWVVVLFNMAFADILAFMYPGFLAEVVTGTAEGVEITPMLLLVAAVFIEIAIAMIYLTNWLSPKHSRTVNLVAVAVTILFVVAGGSLKIHYVFFATFEVIALLRIGHLAWHWRHA